jgi:hypothetical protein
VRIFLYAVQCGKFFRPIYQVECVCICVDAIINHAQKKKTNSRAKDAGKNFSKIGIERKTTLVKTREKRNSRFGITVPRKIELRKK